MKAILTCLLVLIYLPGFGIGRPHNLFVARKQLIERRTASPSVRPPMLRQRAALRVWCYSAVLLPSLYQLSGARK